MHGVSVNGMIALLALIAPLWVGATAEPRPDGIGLTNRVLIIDRSATAVSGGKATLIIGPLERAGQVCAGNYQRKVSPYFFKGEKGRLAIVVSDESLARVAKGMVTEITGTATTNGRAGETRPIDATATPADKDHGTLKLWFIAEERKMVFNTSYRLFFFPALKQCSIDNTPEHL